MQPTSNVLQRAQPRRALRRDESGATIVEMAVVFGLFLLLTFAIIEFAWMFATQNELEHLAGEGARRASVGADPNPVVCNTGRQVVADTTPGLVTYSMSFDALSPGPGSIGTITVEKDYSGFSLPLVPAVARPLSASRSFFVEGNLPPVTNCS